MVNERDISLAPIAKEFKSARFRRNLKQKEFAELLNCSPATISNIENQKIAPNKELIERFSDIAEVPIEKLNYLLQKGDAIQQKYQAFKEWENPVENREANELKVVNIRLVKEPSLYSKEPISSPRDVTKLIADELSQYDREVFAVLNLKTSGEVINLNIVSVGTLNASMVSPRELFKGSILSNAASFIAIHNHPSGNLNPSDADRVLTERLMVCGRYMDIKMLDHIIVAGETGEIFSFKSEGLMDDIERSARDKLSFATEPESALTNTFSQEPALRRR